MGREQTFGEQVQLGQSEYVSHQPRAVKKPRLAAVPVTLTPRRVEVESWENKSMCGSKHSGGWRSGDRKHAPNTSLQEGPRKLRKRTQEIFPQTLSNAPMKGGTKKEENTIVSLWNFKASLCSCTAQRVPLSKLFLSKVDALVKACDRAPPCTS